MLLHTGNYFKTLDKIDMYFRYNLHVRLLSLFCNLMIHNNSQMEELNDCDVGQDIYEHLRLNPLINITTCPFKT